MTKKSNITNNDEVTDPNELVELRKEDSKQPLVDANSADTVSLLVFIRYYNNIINKGCCK